MCSYADESVVGVPVTFIYVVDIVGTDKRDIHFFGEKREFPENNLFFFQPMVLDLQVVSVTKEVLEPSDSLFGFFFLASQNQTRNLP